VSLNLTTEATYVRIEIYCARAPVVTQRRRGISEALGPQGLRMQPLSRTWQPAAG